jgi:RNA polymerase sigma-70 factor (ECF subfamily)
LIGSEQEAIAALRNGDVQGLEILVRLYQLRAIRVAYAITSNRETAEDVAADAFLSVYDHIEQYDDSRPFGPWFFRIVTNAALKSVRKTGSHSHEDGPQTSEQLDSAVGPEEAAVIRETRAVVFGAMNALPPQQRAVLVLRYYLDMDEAAISEVLGCPLGTVKWRLHAARERLRGSLTPEFGTLASEDVGGKSR